MKRRRSDIPRWVEGVAAAGLAVVLFWLWAAAR